MLYPSELTSAVAAEIVAELAGIFRSDVPLSCVTSYCVGRYRAPRGQDTLTWAEAAHRAVTRAALNGRLVKTEHGYRPS